MEIQSALIEVFIQEIGLQKGSSISILAGMSFATCVPVQEERQA